MKITESRIENLEEILSIIHNAIIDMLALSPTPTRLVMRSSIELITTHYFISLQYTVFLGHL